jgi:hypothetical protein
MLHFLHSSQTSRHPLLLILYMADAADFTLAMQVVDVHLPMLRNICILLDLSFRLFFQPSSMVSYSCLKARKPGVKRSPLCWLGCVERRMTRANACKTSVTSSTELCRDQGLAPTPSGSTSSDGAASEPVRWHGLIVETYLGHLDKMSGRALRRTAQGPHTRKI